MNGSKMKTIRTIISIAAGMAAIASCTAELKSPETIERSSDVKVFKTVLSKTSLDSTTPKWEEGDSVKIFWVETPEGTPVVKNTKAAVNAADGTISAVVGEARDFYYAVYPQWATSDLVITEGQTDSLTVTVRSTSKDGSWNQAHYAAALTDASNATFNFKNISSAIKFTVNTPGVTKVQFSTPDNAPTAAKIRFSFNGEEPCEDPKFVTPQVISTVTVDGPGTYYAPVAYSAQWLTGFVVSEFVGENLASFSVAQNPVVWERSVIMDLNTVESHATATHDWFFKENGDGDGTSWDNAAGPAKLIELLGNASNFMYVSGRNLYLAAGTYNLKSGSSIGIEYPTPTSFNLMGGYPTNASGNDLTGRDVETNKTILFTNSTESNPRIFFISGGKVGNILFDGLQFGPYDGLAATTRGYALYVNNSADFSSANAKITINNCTFTGIKGKYYGAIDLNNEDGRMSITNCTFTGNQAEKTGFGGAGLYVENASDLVVEKCTFSNNAATTNAFGGAVVIALGKVQIKDCVFTNNSSVNLGGAVGVGAVKGNCPDVTISNCQFNSNTAQHAGAVNHCFGTLLCEGCTFTENSCTRAAANVGGGAFATFYFAKDGSVPDDVSSYPNRSETANTFTTLRNCQFTENHAYGRGGAIHHISAGSFLIDGCMFKGNYNSTKANGGGAIYHAGTSGCCDIKIANSIFDGNWTDREGSANGSGAAFNTKNGSRIFFYNCAFTANSTKTGSFGVISTSDANTGLYMFRCSFLNNATDGSILRIDTRNAFIANCSFCETGKDFAKGIISSTGSKTTTALNNIVIASSASKYSFGSSNTIASGYNVYSALNGVTLSPASGAADIAGKAADDIFSSTAFDENKKLPVKAGLQTVSAATIKNAINESCADFYSWLDTMGAFSAMPSDNWIPGAYQN